MTRLFGGRAKPKAPAGDLAAWVRIYLMTGQRPPRGSAEWSEYYRLKYGTGELERLWRVHRDDLVAACVRETPGRRPPRWWLEPEHADDFDDGPMLEGKEAQADYRRRVEAAEAESEASTLRRRGWLEPGELERIEPAAFDPVPPEPDPRLLLKGDTVH